MLLPFLLSSPEQKPSFSLSVEDQKDTSILISEDGQTVVQETPIKLEIRRGGKVVRGFLRQPTGPTAISADGQWVAFGDGTKGLRLEKTDGKDAGLRPNTPSSGVSFLEPEAMAFSPDGKTLAVVAGSLYHHGLFFVDLPSGTARATALRDFDLGTRSLAWSKDSRRVAGADFVGFVVARDGSVALRPQNNGEKVNAKEVRTVQAQAPHFVVGQPYACAPTGRRPLDTTWPAQLGSETFPRRVVIAPDGSWEARLIGDRGVWISRPAGSGIEPGIEFDKEGRAGYWLTRKPAAYLWRSDRRWLYARQGDLINVFDLSRKGGSNP